MRQDHFIVASFETGFQYVPLHYVLSIEQGAGKRNEGLENTPPEHENVSQRAIRLRRKNIRRLA